MDFMDEIQLSQGYRAIMWRQFIFYHSVLRSSWYSFNRPRKDERLKTFVIILITLLMKYCQDWSMYLVFIYNGFVFNLFFNFLLLLTFIYVVLRFKLVLGYFCGRIEELYMSGKTSLAC